MRAKRFQTGLFLIRNQINGAIAATLASNWAEGMPCEALAELVPRVMAVSADQVRSVGRRLMTSRSQTVVIGGDAARVTEDVAPLGAATLVGGESAE